MHPIIHGFVSMQKPFWKNTQTKPKTPITVITLRKGDYINEKQGIYIFIRHAEL